MQSSKSNQYHPKEQWHQWLDQLAENDFVYVDNFVTDDLYRQIQRYFQALLNEQKFAKTAIRSSESAR